MKTIILAAILLLAAPRAEAVTLVFHDSSTPFQHADWFGTFDPSTHFFSALIGVCSNPLNCTYDEIV